MPSQPYWTKLREGQNGCIEWSGKVRPDGYARSNGAYLHRAEYERLVGPIPDGLELDHLCRNRACVNVLHLEPVTRSVNTFRGDHPNRRVSVCPQGHPYSGDNLYQTPQGRRMCRTCMRARTRAQRARRKAA